MRFQNTFYLMGEARIMLVLLGVRYRLWRSIRGTKEKDRQLRKVDFFSLYQLCKMNVSSNRIAKNFPVSSQLSISESDNHCSLVCIAN